MKSPNAKFWAAVATLVGFLLTKFGLPLPPEVADAVSTVIVVLGPPLVWKVPNTERPQQGVGLPAPTTYRREDGHIDLSGVVSVLLILLLVVLLLRLL